MSIGPSDAGISGVQFSAVKGSKVQKTPRQLGDAHAALLARLGHSVPARILGRRSVH